MRGRPPTPDKIHRLRGNPSRKRLSDSEPVDIALAAAEPPTALDETAAAIWQKVAPELIEAGILKSLDEGLLASYCESRALAIEAASRLSEQSPVIATKDGSRRNPWFSVFMSATATAHKLAGELGMTPTSRARLAPTMAQKPRAPSPWDEF